MEDDLKILKVDYLRKDRFDLPPILNISLGDQTETENCSCYVRFRTKFKVRFDSEENSKMATNTFHDVLKVVKLSGLNYKMEIFPFSRHNPLEEFSNERQKWKPALHSFWF